MSIPGLQDWLSTPQGQYVLSWEQAKVEQAVGDIFGFHAVQLGLPECDFLAASRIPLRLCAGDAGPIAVACDFRELPFATGSVDLVILPHVLEFAEDPHQVLREVERILIPEGQVVVIGFNPLSLWGLRRGLARRRNCFPWNGRYLSVQRLKDWLQLLGFEVNRGSFGCYAPPLRQERAFSRFRFMELAGDRWWGFAGGVYMVRAVKRVAGMRLIQPAWHNSRRRAKSLAPIAQKNRRLLTHRNEH